ncbi:MAG: relaxase/mobilization nuclease domain-containing protein, partial [Bacteroidales bacterium]|nr:relaxase/mobilization nuclease domain-containing protein [Bacteroidales bacterium]
NRHRPLVNTMIKIEVSPSEEETAGWTLEDWIKLTDDFIRAFDAVDLSGKTKRSSAKSTNIRNSQYVAMLHHDSASGILHLHITANRVDMDGNINDDHCIHERAMEAANKVTEERGWVQAKVIREQNRSQIYKDCIAILDQMGAFTWERYERDIRALGYGIEIRRDSNDQITGYTILKGHSRFKSSELSPSRDITPARILKTWKELHPESQHQSKPVPPVKQTPVAPTETKHPQPKPLPKEPEPVKMVHREITLDRETLSFDVPKPIFDYFRMNVSEPEGNPDSSREKVLHSALLLFAGYVDGATTVAENCGGGGRSSSDDWGRKPDEDDLRWARRCIQRAQELHKKRYSYRRRR